MVRTAFCRQMFPPAFLPIVYVFMAQRTSVGHRNGFCRIAFFGLDVRSKISLVYCLLTPWTSFIVFTVFALGKQMTRIAIDFDSLLTLAKHQHWTSIEKMNVSVVFIDKVFVEFSTKLACVLWIYSILCRLNFSRLFRLLLRLSILRLLKFLLFLTRNWHIFVIGRHLVLHHCLNTLDNRSPNILQKWCYDMITHFLDQYSEQIHR